MELGSQQYVKGPGIIIPLTKVLLNSGFPVCKPSVNVSPSNMYQIPKSYVSIHGR